MTKLSTLLLIVTVISVVHGWFEAKIPITSDSCVGSIEIIINEFDPTKNFFKHFSGDEKSLTKFCSLNVPETLATIKNNSRNELSALITAAKQIRPMEMYYHEIRQIRHLEYQLSVACPQEIAYKVAEICYSTTSDIAAFVFQNRL